MEKKESLDEKPPNNNDFASSESKLSKLKLKTTFEDVIYKGVKDSVLALSVLFFFVSIINFFVLPEVASRIVVPFSVSLSIICGSISYILSKNRVEIKTANFISGIIGVLAVVHALLLIYFIKDPTQIVGLVLVLIATSSLLISIEWLAVVIVVAVVGWFTVVFLVNKGEWLRSGFLVLASAGLSYLVFVIRMYALVSIENLNLQYQARKTELENVLKEKEKANFQVEEALKQLKSSKEDFKVLINSINGIVWESNIALSEFRFVSKKAEKILGYKTSSWLGEKNFWFSHIHPEDKERVLLYTTNEVKYGRDYELEYRMIASDGSIIWLKDIATVVFENGQVNKLQGVMFDITDSKRVEIALVRSENRYRDLFEKASDIIYTHDLSGKFISINDHAEEILGYKKEEILQMNIGQILLPEELDRVKDRMKRRLAGEVLTSHELTLTTKEKKQIIFEVSSWLEFENNLPVAIHGIARDITKRKVIEEALKESEERYRSLFNKAPIGIYRSTPEGKIIDANSRVIKMMGCESLAELTERDLEKDGLDANYSRSQFREILESEGQIIGLESEWITRKGEKRFIRENASVIKNAQGKTLYYDGTIEDITERKKTEDALRRNEKQYRLLFENNPCPCFVYDSATLKFLAANKAAIQHYGYTLEEFTSMTIKDIRPSEDVPTLLRFLSEGNHEAFQAKHWRHCKKNGIVFDVEVSSDDAIFEGRPARLVLAKDITERKQTETLLKVARDTAVESAQFKSQFLANMSHEIRTPLNGVIGMTYLLQDTNLTDKQKEYIETIRNCGDSLLTLINDILDLAKIESGKINFEETNFDLGTLVTEVVTIFKNKTESKALNLYYHIDKTIPSYLVGDPNRLRQVLVNLVSNAIKFTDKGSVTINLKLEKETEEKVCIKFEVIDSGIGISSQVIDKLFQPFTQADSSTTRNYGGTGLGLAICKQLIEGMGGTISVESSLGKGSNFWFTLNFLKHGESGLEELDKALKVFLQDLRVLVIDSTSTNAHILQQIKNLKMRGDYTEDGHKALEMLHLAFDDKDPYELVIIDRSISDLKMIDLARLIKSDSKISGVKIIMLVSKFSGELSKEATNIGISSYLHKPVNDAQLYQCLRNTLKPSLRKQISELSFQNGNKVQIRGENLDTKILLVEDNQVNQSVAKSILNKLGYSVDVVGNGLKALGKLFVTNYDLILMDCQMPVMDGYEATMAIRNEEEKNNKAHIPIIALTAGAMQEDKKRCFDSGMDDYITKPFNPLEMELMLKKWLGRDSDLFIAGGTVKKNLGLDKGSDKCIDKDSDNRELVTLDVHMLAQLVSISENDDTFFQRISLLFFKTTEQSLLAIDLLIQESDLVSINREAHKLKSACSNIGAVKMASICHTIEKSKELNNCQKLVIDLNSEYKAFKKEIKARLGEEAEI